MCLTKCQALQRKSRASEEVVWREFKVLRRRFGCLQEISTFSQHTKKRNNEHRVSDKFKKRIQMAEKDLKEKRYAFYCVWIHCRIFVGSVVRDFLVLCREDLTSWPLYWPSGGKAGKKKKAKGGTKTSKSNGTCWANMPLPPPPMHPLPGTEVDLDHYPQENHGGG